MLKVYLLSVFLAIFFINGVDGQYTYNCKQLTNCLNGGVCLSDGTCQCETGFDGYNCQIITGTTCATGLVCNNGGTCYVDNSVDTCACAFGFYGDTCDGESILVTCGGPTANFSLTFPDTFGGIVRLDGNAIPDICSFSSVIGNGVITYGLTVNVEQDTDATICGRDNIIIEPDPASSDANYTAAIMVRYYSDVVTDVDQLFSLKCIHAGQSVVVSKDITNIGVDPKGNLTQVEVSKKYSPVDFEIVTSAGAVLPEILYVGDSYRICFYLTDISIFKNLFIRSCTTNNTLDAPDNKTYELFSSGCPTTEGMRVASIQVSGTKTINDFDFPSVCLPVQAFKFVDSENLAVTCQVRLCRENASNCDMLTEDECGAVRASQDASAATTAAPPGGNDNTTTAAPAEGGDNTTTAAPAAGNDNTTTAAPAAGGDNNASTAPPGAGNEATTAAPDAGRRRKRRAADDEEAIEEKTVSTVLTVYGSRDFSSDKNQGQQETTVEECLSQTEIMAVVTVLGSVVLILFIACFTLICILIKKRSKLNLFEPHTHPKPERFNIPRAHVNQAYREF